MRCLYKAVCGALLVFGLAGIAPEPVFAGGYHWDADCNCRRPDSQYTTHRYVPLPPRVVTHQRVVDRTRVVRGNTRVIQENRVVVHVQPVIHREVVVHRTNTVVKDVVVHRVNTIATFREEPRYEVVNRYVGGYVRHVTEYHSVRGANCNCGYTQQVSYRD